jgi:hypothetical protein
MRKETVHKEVRTCDLEAELRTRSRRQDRAYHATTAESDRAALRRLSNPMRGFQSLRSAKATLGGMEAICAIKKHQYESIAPSVAGESGSPQASSRRPPDEPQAGGSLNCGPGTQQSAFAPGLRGRGARNRAVDAQKRREARRLSRRLWTSTRAPAAAAGAAPGGAGFASVMPHGQTMLLRHRNLLHRSAATTGLDSSLPIDCNLSEAHHRSQRAE